LSHSMEFETDAADLASTWSFPSSIMFAYQFRFSMLKNSFWFQ
jgi:hypothetical protein